MNDVHRRVSLPSSRSTARAAFVQGLVRPSLAMTRCHRCDWRFSTWRSLRHDVPKGRLTLLRPSSAHRRPPGPTIPRRSQRRGLQLQRIWPHRPSGGPPCLMNRPAHRPGRREIFPHTERKSGSDGPAGHPSFLTMFGKFSADMISEHYERWPVKRNLIDRPVCSDPRVSRLWVWRAGGGRPAAGTGPVSDRDRLTARDAGSRPEINQANAKANERHSVHPASYPLGD